MPVSSGSLSMAIQDVVERALRGEREAREALVHEWQPRLLTAALRLLRYRRHDAEEAVQDAWLRIWGSAEGLRDPASWAAWIYRILRNCCLKRRQVPAGAPLPDVAAPDAAAEPPDLVPLALALQRMPDAYREAVILRYQQKLEYHEIAEVLEIAVGTAKSNVHRGIAWLEKNLKEFSRD